MQSIYPVGIKHWKVFGEIMRKSNSSNFVLFLQWGIRLLSINWLTQAALAYAQTESSAASSTAETSQKGYVLAYIFVVFVVALGVAVVARSGNRADKPKMVEKDLEHRLKQMSGRSDDR